MSEVTLITGASGFIGGRLRAALLEAGKDVVAIRRASSPEPSAGRSVVADYADVQGLAELLRSERPAQIFHVAGATKGVSYQDFQRANVMPTRHLIEALRAAEHTPQRFVFMSSLTSYGPSSPEAPLDEGAPRNPVEHYGRSKREAEDLLEAVDDIPWTILRPGGVFGPGDVDYFELFKAAHKGLNTFFGNRQRWMSVIYVDDLVDATLQAAAHPAAAGQGYMMCDGQPVTWETFQGVIKEEAGRKVRDLDLPEALVGIAAFGGELLTKLDKKPRLLNKQKAIMGAQAAWTCTHAKAARDFGYAPKVSQREGVRRAFAWYRDNGWL